MFVISLGKMQLFCMFSSATAAEFDIDEMSDMTGKISYVSSNWLTINLYITVSWQFLFLVKM